MLPLKHINEKTKRSQGNIYPVRAGKKAAALIHGKTKISHRSQTWGKWKQIMKRNTPEHISYLIIRPGIEPTPTLYCLALNQLSKSVSKIKANNVISRLSSWLTLIPFRLVLTVTLSPNGLPSNESASLGLMTRIGAFWPVGGKFTQSKSQLTKLRERWSLE